MRACPCLVDGQGLEVLVYLMGGQDQFSTIHFEIENRKWILFFSR